MPRASLGSLKSVTALRILAQVGETIGSDAFFEGRYEGRVITVHSNQSGQERDDTIEQLLSVEDPDNPTEIVIHVNMLKEGWDAGGAGGGPYSRRVR